jgi:hypothetical protein
MNKKPITFLLFLCFLITVFSVMGQEDVEKSYSPDYVNLVIIHEQSRSPERNLKMGALALIGKLLEQNKKDAEILSALEYMTLEGTVNKARVNGQITNSYPDVRAKAALYLGDFGGDAAKKVLIQMIKADPETMVLAQAVNALSKIGIVAEDEVLFNDMMRRFDTRYPDNFLALAVLGAYQKYLEEYAGKLNIATREIIYHISQGNYRAPVKKKAKQLLEQGRSYTKKE